MLTDIHGNVPLPFFFFLKAYERHFLDTLVCYLRLRQIFAL